MGARPEGHVVITFEGVTKRYPGGTLAVDDLNLEIPDGQTMVLVGPSGCGKTTTLRMINRLIDPTSGRILLDGRDIQQSDPPTLRRGIGYVIQQSGLFPHRTIEDNIGTVPLLIGWGKAKARARARELMGLVGLDDSLARRYPYQLSGGQQQRVGVARALAADPPVLLMDEPFSAVDPIVRATLQDELLRLQAELHKTVVLVTHDVEEAIKVGDQVAIFRPRGQMAQVDTPGAAADRARGQLRGELPRLRPRHPPAVLPGRVRAEPGRHGRGQRQHAAPGRRPQHAQRSGEPWLLVTDADQKPRGWVASDELESLPREATAGDAQLSPYGHTFGVSTDSLRAALDATVLSPTGRAVGVDDQGRVVGVTSYERLGAAIEARAARRRSRHDAAAGAAEPATEASPTGTA